MIVVYIASPYALGDVEQNVRAQIDAADELARLGFVPRWPLATHFWHMVHPHDHQFWMDLDIQELLMCDVLLRLPGESMGADLEVNQAIGMGMPVFYSVSDLFEQLGRDLNSV